MAEPSLPSWLNTTLMENGLQKALKNKSLKVLKSEASVANAAGDHYGSKMYRFKLTIQTAPETNEAYSIVVKVLPECKFIEEEETNIIFEREVKSYAEALPLIYIQLKKAFPGCEILWPEYYFHQEAPDWLIVMKDLKCDGYTLANRFEGLDLDHTTYVLKSLAKFHAASIPAIKANPKEFKVFDKCFWVLYDRDVLGKFFENPFSGFLKDLPNWPEFEGKDMCIEKLAALQDTFLEKTFGAWEKDDSKLNVFLHGDAWMNNFMFKYGEDGKPNRIKFVDFQISNINTPALDIQYLIFTSVTPSVKFDHIDYFLQTYYDTFEDTLNRLGHKLDIPFGMKELKRDFEEKYAWGFAVFFCLSPIISAPPEDIMQLDEFYENESGSNFTRAYRRKDVRETLIRGLKFFNQKGIL